MSISVASFKKSLHQLVCLLYMNPFSVIFGSPRSPGPNSRGENEILQHVITNKHSARTDDSDERIMCFRSNAGRSVNKIRFTEVVTCYSEATFQLTTFIVLCTLARQYENYEGTSHTTVDCFLPLV